MDIFGRGPLVEAVEDPTVKDLDTQIVHASHLVVDFAKGAFPPLFEQLKERRKLLGTVTRIQVTHNPLGDWNDTHTDIEFAEDRSGYRD